MILAQKNAKLISVGRGGASEDYDTPSGGGSSAVWTGSVDAYFGRRRASAAEGSVLNQTSVAFVVVPGDLEVDFATGDVVTLKQEGVTFTRKVREFADRELSFALSQPIRLDLEDE